MRVASPLLIAFAAPSSLVVERDRPSQFPILGNGSPGTFVLFPGRLRVSLPTDQVVSADDTGGYAKVGFGGMRFTGMTRGRLVFVRERDLYPVDQLSPDRSHTMRLEPQWVASIFAYVSSCGPPSNPSGVFPLKRGFPARLRATRLTGRGPTPRR